MDNNEIVVEMSESAGVGEPEVHSTPVNRSKEYSLTESAIDDSSTQSTPTSTKCNNQFDNDIMSMLRAISRDINEQKSEIQEIKSNFNKFDEQNNKFEEIKSNFNEKLNEQNNEIKSNFNEKLNEIRDEIKQQNFDINKSLEEVSEHFSVIVKQVQDLSLIHI